MNPMVKVQCIKHIYPDRTEVSLCGMDFIIEQGQRVVVLGANGEGKTTLLSHVLGLLKPVEGTVEVMGLSPYDHFHQTRRQMGVVFQNADEQMIGPRVYDDIAFTARNEGMQEEEIKEKVKAMAKELGIEPLLSKVPHYLSGGQKKKVALAGAMITEPPLLILDEPFDSLDPKSKNEFIDQLNYFHQKKGTTLLITTHDMNIVPLIADVVYVIYQGQIVLKGSWEEVFQKEEILEKAHLQAPLLVDLFLRLRKKGYNLSLPATTEEGEAQILTLLDK
ncbi:MAG: energy-coupling factor ABC transporter ATP-binding protein [Epulopiscium sp.]|nr:energy-coupling factor ABC transporter ATP-binding protein [Candidatus Epulonipiscium sp.]